MARSAAKRNGAKTSRGTRTTVAVQGARVHNLKNISLEIPRDSLIVVTGLSGSGKSSLAFDTIYAEGQRRYMESLSSYAKRFIAQYFERFSGVRRYLDEMVAGAKERGYVETLLGRRRYIPELADRNWNIKQFGERVAQNTPIQGTAADLIKKAMIDVDAALEKSDWGARLLLTVHDELLFEVPEDRLDEVRSTVVDLMEHAMELSVPIRADVGVGRTWYEAKG